MQDRLKIVISPNGNGEVPSDEEVFGLAADAGWNGDPLCGHTVLIPDERGQPGYEVFNPIPIAAPIGWEPTPPIEQLIRERVRLEYARLEGEDEVDDIVDAEDFDIPDDIPSIETIYEVMAMEEEAPAVKPVQVSAEQRVKDELDFEELKDRERRLRLRRSREEYDRRQQELEELHGPSKRVLEALERRGEEEGGR